MSYCNRCGAPHQGRCLRPDDALRDRIAQVLFARNAGLDWDMMPRSWDGTDEDVRADWLADADAVIRELNLSVAVDYLSVDGTRRNVMLAGHYTMDVTAGDARRQGNEPFNPHYKMTEGSWKLPDDD